jgi:hypothetical protein
VASTAAGERRLTVHHGPQDVVDELVDELVDAVDDAIRAFPGATSNPVHLAWADRRVDAM